MRHRVIGASAPEQRQEQRQSLLYKSLAGEIADRVVSIAFLGDRKRRRERQIGILGLLGKLVMLQMIRPVAREVGADRDRAQPLSDPLIDRLVAVKSAMRGLMHQYGKTQLARANNRHRDQPGQ